jgi:polyhydroxyalkanoate synthesis regulator phasin
MSEKNKDDKTPKSSVENDSVASTIVSQKTHLPEKTYNAQASTEIGDKLVDKLKKGLSMAYETGTKVVDELSQIAHGYIEKYKAESEINRLKEQKDMLMLQMGELFLKHHLAGGRFQESFLNRKELIDLYNQIDSLDQKIIEAGKLLDIEKE